MKYLLRFMQFTKSEDVQNKINFKYEIKLNKPNLYMSQGFP